MKSRARSPAGVVKCARHRAPLLLGPLVVSLPGSEGRGPAVVAPLPDPVPPAPGPRSPFTGPALPEPTVPLVPPEPRVVDSIPDDAVPSDLVPPALAAGEPMPPLPCAPGPMPLLPLAVPAEMLFVPPDMLLLPLVLPLIVPAPMPPPDASLVRVCFLVFACPLDFLAGFFTCFLAGFAVLAPLVADGASLAAASPPAALPPAVSAA